MSGGSMNYLYSRLEWEATFEQNTPERKAFAEHLKLVGKALHDIEWVDSADYGPGDDTKAIRACLPQPDCRVCWKYRARRCASVLQCEDGSQFEYKPASMLWAPREDA